MVLGHLISLAVISGIFSKRDEELDILPPPPPFPEIEIGEKLKEFERARKKEEKQRERKFELERKKEEEKKKQKEIERKKAEEREKREKELERRRKSAEKRKNEKLREEKKKARKKKVFEFFHGLGLVKTEKEKREIEKNRQKEKELKEFEKKKRDEEEKRIELEKKKPEEKAVLGKKKEKSGIAKELGELEEITPKPAKKEKIKEIKKLGIPELIPLKTEEIEKKIVKPEEVVKAEEEIQKAISGIKKAKRPSVIKSLFKGKKEPVAVERMTETPAVMPRTYDKIDHVELIEEKIHKARLMLMDFRFDDAKRVYIEIMKMYNELEPKKRAKVYQDIKDLYYERKSAEKFAK